MTIPISRTVNDGIPVHMRYSAPLRRWELQYGYPFWATIAHLAHL